MPDIRLGATDISAMKLGSTAIAKVMHGATEIWPGGVCTDVLAEPFDNLLDWSNLSGVATITYNGRTGSCLTCNGASRADYPIPDIDESDVITIGFAFAITGLSSPLSIIELRSDTAATKHSDLLVYVDGHLSARRAGDVEAGATTAGVITAATFYYLEIQAKLHDSAGYLKVRVNGTQLINATGIDTKTAGTKTVYDTLRLVGTAGFASRFDDLYLSTGAACSFKGSTVVPTVSGFKTALGTQVATTSGSTLVITTTAAIAVGDLVVVRVAADNLSATTPTFTCADSGGNSYTTHREGAVNATGALGVAGAIMCSRATNPISAGGTITVTLSGAVAARAAYAESFTGYLNTVRSTTVSATGASASPASPASGAVTAGDLVLGCTTVENNSAVTADSDTTGGSWSTIVTLVNTAGGTAATRVQVSGQYKIAVSTAAQTYNNTITSTEWVALLVVLQLA